MIRLATRQSPLARKQAARAAVRIEQATEERVQIVPLSSLGDEDQIRPLARFLQPGAFTGRLDEALQNDEADLAVHSLKDVPLQPARGVSRTYVLERADPADRLVLREEVSVDGLAGKRVGTSAPRRRSQLHAHEADAIAVDVRGAIGTRLQRIEDGELDALFVAAAALERGEDALPHRAHPLRLPLSAWPTAPGQGALALQAASGGPGEKILERVEDATAARAVAAERGLLADLGGGCGTPLGATCLPPGDPEGHTTAWTLHVTFPRDGALDAFTLHETTPEACRKRALARLQERPDRPVTPAPRPDKRVLLVMDPETSPLWEQRLRAEGCAAAYWWPFETIDLTADDAERAARCRAAFHDADWVVVTSVRAVPLCARLHHETEALPRFAAVGPATARALQAADLPVTLVPSTTQGADLARLVARRAAADGRRKVFWPSGRRFTPDTEDALRDGDLEVTRIAVYDIRPTDSRPPEGHFDALLVTSPRTARYALERLEGAKGLPPLYAIGPTTAAALAERGRSATTLPSPTPTALLRQIRSR